ncbi:hypothetical protein OSB04_005147 [Centaurea solstitialis]|uniref:Transcription factor MYC/MYB N-terminal domain-containing protein n=1 Tax=Centaurea solstitialis TaxID=347529 RepID=A0AA38WG56_9ASTR|nr:hypothetical protein OSB04_005147 [Centaurea solstitialis]
MEAGLPILTCLIQHTLKSLCTCSSSSDPKWVYAVFWRISPRIYPPPKWDYEGGVLDRAKGNKRNWILVWDDGFCDLDECERVGNHGLLKSRFGAEIFFKLSHEVYNFGEGLIGKVAADNSHRWVFKDGSNENDPSFISSWNTSIDLQPKAWEFHFNSGIKTIAIISVREGIVQLGSFDKILEDMNLVISIQRKFGYLRSIPGLFSIQRPFSTIQHMYNPLKHKAVVDGNTIGSDEAQQVIASKVNIHDVASQLQKGPILSFGSDYKIQEIGRIGSHGPPLWHIPPLLPSNFGSHFDKMPSYNDPTHIRNNCIPRVEDPSQEGKPAHFHPNSTLVMELGFGSKKVAQESDVKSQLS